MHDNDIDVEAEVNKTMTAAKYGMAVMAVIGFALLLGTVYAVYLLFQHFGVIMAGVPL
jgi:hypothetical protein